MVMPLALVNSPFPDPFEPLLEIDAFFPVRHRKVPSLARQVMALYSERLKGDLLLILKEPLLFYLEVRLISDLSKI